MYMRSIAENLKHYRTKAGLTQKDVESRLRMRELMIKDFETGRLKLPAETAIKLAKLYQVSLDELLLNKNENQGSAQLHLIQIQGLFGKSEIDILYLDPVIRAHLEDHQEKILESSLFDLLTWDLTEKQKKEFTSEVLKTLGSLMGIDGKVTKEELHFLNDMIVRFELEDKLKSITKSISSKHLPNITHFHGKPAAKHFLIWLMFFMAKSDGASSPEEIAYLQECAELLKINRSNFLMIQKFFIKEKF